MKPVRPEQKPTDFLAERNLRQVIAQPKGKRLGEIAELLAEQVQSAYVGRIRRDANAHTDVGIFLQLKLLQYDAADGFLIQRSAGSVHPPGF